MTQGTRPDRVGDLVRMEIATMITRDLRDPGVRGVTVTRVRMTRDLQHARVYYTVLDETGVREAGRALRRARPFLRKQIGLRLRLRHVPELTFLHDDAVVEADRIERLFEELASERARNDADDEQHEH